MVDRTRLVAPGSVVKLGLDKFLALDAGHGSAPGDRVLAAVADLIRRIAPDAGPARLGGDR